MVVYGRWKEQRRKYTSICIYIKLGLPRARVRDNNWRHFHSGTKNGNPPSGEFARTGMNTI